MTAWTVLVGNSTLPDNGVNTSWDHLNNQSGGGGGAPYPVYLIHTNAADVETTLEADVTDVLTAAAITETEAAVIDPQVLTATVTTITTAEID